MTTKTDSPDAAESEDLDFTRTVIMHSPPDLTGQNPEEEDAEATKALRQAESLMDSIALKIELGSRDERLYRLLAAMYVATERMSDYGDLARKHLAAFGRPMQLNQPAVVFSLPSKINSTDVPSFDVVRSACATPAGAVIDFSEVRRASAGGLSALSELFTALAQGSCVPELLGSEGFMGSVTVAARSERATAEMRSLAGSFLLYQDSRRVS